MQKRTLYADGNIYKGNLHTHTTLSDGRGTPAEAAAYYKSLGHSFLALTDHNVYMYHKELTTDDFLLLPGVELNTIPQNGDPVQHHIVGIGVEGEVDIPEGARYDQEWLAARDAQDLIDELVAHGNLAVFCHPHWSHADMQEAKGLENIVGMEIMNYGCHMSWNCGLGDAYYDAALWSGNMMWALATDDSHNLHPFTCGACIAVKCAALTNRDITQAIRDGSFYATTGPEIYDFYIEDGTVRLTCSDARSIQFIYTDGFAAAHALPGEHVHELSAQYPEKFWRNYPNCKPYARAVVTDDAGKMAWTQPISL